MIKTGMSQWNRLKQVVSVVCAPPTWLAASQKQIRMFFRLQRLSVYFAKLLESKAYPLWGFDDPIDPRGFAREVRLTS